MLLSNYAIKFRVAVFVFVIVFVLAGISSYVSLPREGTPDITIPYVFITAVYEGTAPEEIEKLVTIPLERQLNDLENVKEMRTVSSDSVTTVAIEFLAGQDIDMALQKAKDKVDLAGPDLPDDLDEPVVQAINFSSDIPVFVFALSGNTPLSRLKNLAEDLKEAIELIPGVRQAEISGVREREVRVELDMRRLAEYGIPIGQLLQRIAGENKTLSAGNLEIKGDKFQVRVPGEYKFASQLADLSIGGSLDSGAVYLRDIATVVDTHKDLDSISRLNGSPSVSISIKKRSGENTVKLIDSVKEVMAEFQLPPAVALTIVMDESEYVDMMIKELENNIATGFILVVIVLFIFMGVRNSLFVAIAIPFSMLIAFSLMAFLGFTLNMIVLFSLVLAVGMLVDNAIVIVENVYRNHSLGMTRLEAARRGAGEVAWPVITSTLTTCAAFSPLLFWPDIMGQFMGFLPRTLIVTLAASLFVAIVINPAICSFFIGGKREEREQKSLHPFVHGYVRFLEAALKHRGLVVMLGIAFLALTVQIYARFGKGVELFPDVAPRSAVIEVKFPQGASIEQTDAVLKDIEKGLPQHEDIKFFLTTVGEGGGGGYLGAGKGTHLGKIHVEFLDYGERAGDSMKLVETLREQIGKVAGAEIKVDKMEEGPPMGAPISIEISGDNFDTLSQISADVMRRIETVPGLVDLQDDYEEALPELRFIVDRERAAMLGLDTTTIGVFLRTAIYGMEASKLRIDEEEFDITLRFPKEQRNSVDMLDEVYIPVGGGSVPLSTLGYIEYAGGRGTISRKDQKRLITISGENQNRGVDKILEDVQKQLEDYALPSGYVITYAGDNQEMQESGAFLARAFAVALGLILVILVIQFNSALLPIIIVFSVVLSLIGVMWGLLICGMRFGVIMTGVGVISLAGIVVNNAIVLLDCVRQRKAEGLTASEAVVEAGSLRLRPVLLTAVTTILGLIPMAIGYSFEFHEWPPSIIAGAESSQWWAPMAVAVIFGLGVATVLTLVLVPLMYSLVDSFAAWMLEHFGIREE